MPWGLTLALGLAAALGALELVRRRRERVWLGAFLEQARRELEHQVEYRHDQRVHAIQARLSRHLGRRRAFSAKARRRIERELRK